MEKDRSELNGLVKTNSEKAKELESLREKMPTAPASTRGCNGGSRHRSGVSPSAE